MSAPGAIRLHKQAIRDLQHAEQDRRNGYYEWACNSARQSGEKIIKALFHHLGLRQPRGGESHKTKRLLMELRRRMPTLPIPSDLFDAAQELDHIVYKDSTGQTACCTVAQVEYFDNPELGNRAPYEVINEAQAIKKITAARKITNWAEQILFECPKI